MLAFSKVDRLAIFKNCLNSLLEEDPEPSAILLDMDILRHGVVQQNDKVSSHRDPERYRKAH